MRQIFPVALCSALMDLSKGAERVFLRVFEVQRDEMGKCGPNDLRWQVTEAEPIRKSMRLCDAVWLDITVELNDSGWVQYGGTERTPYFQLHAKGRNRAREILAERSRRWRGVVYWVWQAVLGLMTLVVIPLVVYYGGKQIDRRIEQATTRPAVTSP
jgi:hypothetical protein